VFEQVGDERVMGHAETVRAPTTRRLQRYLRALRADWVGTWHTGP
jgi:hypothetical protein